MNMSIFKRIKTTVAADAHGVIDAIEDRALLLKQYLRDAEADLLRKRARLQLLEQDLRALDRDEKATASELAAFELDARTALAAGNDDLSRYALKAILLRQARQRRQTERREELTRTRVELEKMLAEQNERYESLKERVSAELAAHGTDGACGTPEAISNEQVELELLRRKAKSEVMP
jgi:phage shock protein A